MTVLEKQHIDNAFGVAHRDFQKGLCRYSFFKVNNRVISEDLVQDTFIKTWNYLSKGGEVLFMRAFLYHILNNLIIDHYRKHKTSSLDTMIESGFDPGTDESESIQDMSDAKQVVGLIKLLPQKYQAVMNMRFIENLSPSEISTKTQQSKNTITVQVHRGLAKMRTLYAEKTMFAMSS